MAKFYGTIGYCQSVEGTGDREGIFEDIVTERQYFGDVLQNSRRWEKGTDINDDLNISNKISIMADAFAWEHSYAIKYITWMGCRWKVTGLEIQRPRLILTIGGVYNGPTPETT